MPELTPQIVEEVMAACAAGEAEATEALRRALDAPLTLKIGQPGPFSLAPPPENLAGPGLVLVLTVGSSAALVVIPQSSGLLSPWCFEPDKTGQAKLSTLAMELGGNLLPESVMPEDFAAACVKNMADALLRGGVADGATRVPLELSVEGEARGTASLIWPITSPAEVLKEPAETSVSPNPSEPLAVPAPAAPAAQAAPASPRSPTPKTATPKPPPKLQTLSSRDLPPYARSLLRIEVPVVVTLAQKRQPLGRIIEIGPGSIIQFEKSCEEMLDLSVGNRLIASGEAVKVGDKFGLRITTITPPDERFYAIQPLRKKTG